MRAFPLFFFVVCVGPMLWGNRITVCPSCQIHSIQAAVDQARPHDTVFVMKGIYVESSIRILKPLHLIGQKNTTLDGGGKKQSIFAVQTDSFSIDGFHFTNVGLSYTSEIAAIFVANSKHFTLSNNQMDHVFYGIILQHVKYGHLLHNTVEGKAIDETSSGNGIHIWKASHIHVEDNHISGMRDGIYFEFVNKSKILRNTSQNNVRYGLHFMFSNHDEYHHNEFRNNGAGVAVMFSKFIKMHHNIFHYNWGTASYGLLLKEINDADIKWNHFVQNTIGINIDGCNRITYENNDFVRNGWALRFTGGCYTNVFKNNNFMYNAFDLSYNSRVNNNLFNSNYWSEYNGYDLDKDGVGDVPYRPVKLFSYIVNKTPETLVLLRSLFVDIINFSEKVSPVFTPDQLVDKSPLLKPVPIPPTPNKM